MSYLGNTKKLIEPRNLEDVYDEAIACLHNATATDLGDHVPEGWEQLAAAVRRYVAVQSHRFKETQ